jgi:hypothetical protein
MLRASALHLGGSGGVQGAASATATEGAGPGAARDALPKTRLDAWEFAAKSKTARRFVTLGPPRGCLTVRGGQRGGGRPPRGVQGAACATATEGAGPGAARDGQYGMWHDCPVSRCGFLKMVLMMLYQRYLWHDCPETHQQAFVLLLGYRRYLVHVVASHVLCSFEFDVQKLFGDHIQADAIQSSPPEPFLILLFRWGLSLTSAFPRSNGRIWY